MLSHRRYAVGPHTGCECGRGCETSPIGSAAPQSAGGYLVCLDPLTSRSWVEAGLCLYIPGTCPDLCVEYSFEQVTRCIQKRKVFS
jgi:hypothetical protein